jgi:flavin reductase (DIM6/NTAB) family NADH-FMN oxidoreductase RutF
MHCAKTHWLALNNIKTWDAQSRAVQPVAEPNIWPAYGYVCGKTIILWERKHTVVNAEETGWFVWNMATYDLREAVNMSAMELHEDEFVRAGVTPQSCISAPGSRVRESPAHFECLYLSTHRLRGNSNHGWVEVVYGEVMHIHVNDAYLTPEGKMDIPKIRPLARLGYYDYTSVTEVFEMRIPGAESMSNDGLEGKSTK